MIEGAVVKAIRLRSHEEGPICEVVLSLPLNAGAIAELSVALKSNSPVALVVQQLKLPE